MTEISRLDESLVNGPISPFEPQTLSIFDISTPLFAFCLEAGVLHIYKKTKVISNKQVLILYMENSIHKSNKNEINKSCVTIETKRVKKLLVQVQI